MKRVFLSVFFLNLITQQLSADASFQSQREQRAMNQEAVFDGISCAATALVTWATLALYNDFKQGTLTFKKCALLGCGIVYCVELRKIFAFCAMGERLNQLSQRYTAQGWPAQEGIEQKEPIIFTQIGTAGPWRRVWGDYIGMVCGIALANR